VHRFASEIAQLRALGFAEGFAISRCGEAEAPSVVARLESGRIGIAVEFLEPGSAATYSIVPLVDVASEGCGHTSDMWDDIIGNVRRRTPLRDDD